MMEGERDLWRKIKANIKGNLLSGLVLTVPIILTFLVLWKIIIFFDNLLAPLIQRYWDTYIPGLGIILSLFSIYLIGMVTKNYFGRRLIERGEKLLVKIPLAKTIYTGAKQLITTFTGQGKSSFKKVLLLEYPRKGIYSLGFLNGEVFDENSGRNLLSVLVMTSINPASGYLVLMPPEEAVITQLTVEEAMKMIVSGGIVTPDKIPMSKA